MITFISKCTGLSEVMFMMHQFLGRLLLSYTVHSTRISISTVHFIISKKLQGRKVAGVMKARARPRGLSTEAARGSHEGMLIQIVKH